MTATASSGEKLSQRCYKLVKTSIGSIVKISFEHNKQSTLEFWIDMYAPLKTSRSATVLRGVAYVDGIKYEFGTGECSWDIYNQERVFRCEATTDEQKGGRAWVNSHAIVPADFSIY